MKNKHLIFGGPKAFVLGLFLLLCSVLIACKSPTAPSSATTVGITDIDSSVETTVETEIQSVTSPSSTSPTPETTDEPSTEVDSAENPSDPETESSFVEEDVEDDIEDDVEDDIEDDIENDAEEDAEDNVEEDVEDDTEEDVEEDTEEDDVEEEIEWLPMDGQSYIMGNPRSPSLGANHYTMFQENHRLYLNMPFILYGLYMIHDEIPCLSFGVDMNVPVQFCDGVQVPKEGSFVKISAIYSQPPAGIETTYPFACMNVTEIEVLQVPEASDLILYVAALQLFVRSVPDSVGDADKVAVLFQGTPVRILESSCGEFGEWSKIAFDGDVGYGYVKSVYLTEDPLL